jgi:polysaccharide biosynthesis/export protein
MEIRGVYAIVVVALAVAALPSKTSAQSPIASAPEFTVRAGDVLRIRVWPDSALGGEYPIEETGVAYLPVLGAVQAGGMTLSALRAELRRRYGEALRSPSVSVTPIFGVSVLGAVQRPGLYHVDPTHTLFDAISLAGGFRDNARTDRLRLVRDGEVIEVNARRTLEEGGAELALSLRSGDGIVVPEGRQWRMLDLFYGLQSVVLLVTLIGRI